MNLFSRISIYLFIPTYLMFGAHAQDGTQQNRIVVDFENIESTASVVDLSQPYRVGPLQITSEVGITVALTEDSRTNFWIGARTPDNLMTLDFDDPTNNISFNVVQDRRVQGQKSDGPTGIWVYSNETLIGEKNLNFDLDPFTKDINQLFEFENVTKVEIRASDFGLDDIAFQGRIPITVFYINGIRTNATQASLDLFTLKRAVENEFGGSLPPGLGFRKLHNPTAGTIADLREAVQQRFLTLSIDTSASDAILDFGDQPQHIKDVVADEALSLIQNSPATSDVEKHVDVYRAILSDPNESVVLIGHSQGNLINNLSFRLLDSEERQRVRVISVATPDSAVAGGGPYITDFSDFIRILPLALPYNVVNTTNPFDLYYLDRLGHSFRSYYMTAGFSSRDRIIQEVVTAIEELSTQ